MMGNALMYELLNQQAMTQLRRERLIGLEGDHYRVALQLEEAATAEEVAAIQRDLDEINRRIQVHRDVLNPPAQAHPEPAQPDLLPTTPEMEAKPTD